LASRGACNQARGDKGGLSVARLQAGCHLTVDSSFQGDQLKLGERKGVPLISGPSLSPLEGCYLSGEGFVSEISAE